MGDGAEFFNSGTDFVAGRRKQSLGDLGELGVALGINVVMHIDRAEHHRTSR
jgi:hypothetical protein